MREGALESGQGGRESPGKSVSLTTLLLGFTVFLVAVLLGLSAVLSFQQFRDHLAARQQVQAQDAATALGLSLSNAVDGRDQAAVATFINALFDHGHYRQVTYRDTEGEVLVRRDAPPAINDVPAWFRELADLPVPRGTAEVMQGWQRLGQVSVEIDPLAAYRALWHGTLRSVLGFLLVGALAIALAFFGLRLILRPLSQLERQSKLLQGHHLGARVPVPRTRELGNLAIAANQMAQGLEELVAGQIRMIEDLRSQTRQDSLTGLDNRSCFDQRLGAECDSREHASGGCVALIALTGFTEFNQANGYQAGDTVLVRAAERLRELVSSQPGAFAGRRQGADFALYIPAVDEEEARGLLQYLAGDLTVDLAALGADGVAVHIGYALMQPPERSAEILARADNALAQARSESIGTGVEGLAGSAVSYGAQRWRELLTEALAQERLGLLFQPTFARDEQSLWFDQVLAQVEVEGEWVSASQFLPLVERYGLARQLDQAVLHASLERLKDFPAETLCTVISTASIADEGFRQHLLSSLGAGPELSRRLWIALHEDAVRREPSILEELIPGLRALGVRVLVDRFGVGGVSFGYLQRWVIDGVRIDRSFVRHLDQRADARFFIQSIRLIARGRNVRVFVGGVESAEEWAAAQQLEVDGGMGYHLARPSEKPAGRA